MAVTINGTTFDSTSGTPFAIPSNVAMFIVPGTNTLDYAATRSRIMSEYGYDPLGQISPSATLQPGSEGYEMSRTYYLANPSPLFQSLTEQYAQQHIQQHTPGFANVLTEYQAQVLASGVPTSQVRGLEGYSGSQISSAANRYVTEYNQDIVTRASQPQGGTVTLTGPFGSISSIENAKIIVDPLTGEIGAYTQNYHGSWGLIGGVGRYGAQSGEYTVTLPTNQTLNLETISPFWTENLSKLQAPGADIPWRVSASTPALSYVTEKGLGSAITIPSGTGSITIPTTMQVAASEPMTLPTPFISKSPGSIIDLSGIGSTVGSFLSGAVSFWTPEGIANTKNVVTSDVVPASISAFGNTLDLSAVSTPVNAAANWISPQGFAQVQSPAAIEFQQQSKLALSDITSAKIQYDTDFATAKSGGYLTSEGKIDTSLPTGLSIYNKLTTDVDTLKAANAKYNSLYESAVTQGLYTKDTSGNYLATSKAQSSAFDQIDVQLSQALKGAGFSVSTDYSKIERKPLIQTPLYDIYQSFEKNFAQPFTLGAATEFQEKPGTVALNVGIGVGFAIATEGLGSLAESVPWIGRAGSIINPVIYTTKSGSEIGLIPAALTGVYAASVPYRATSELTDFTPSKVSYNLGGILSTETIPMTAGALGATYGIRAAGNIDIKQSVGGITDTIRSTDVLSYVDKARTFGIDTLPGYTGSKVVAAGDVLASSGSRMSSTLTDYGDVLAGRGTGYTYETVSSPRLDVLSNIESIDSARGFILSTAPEAMGYSLSKYNLFDTLSYGFESVKTYDPLKSVDIARSFLLEAAPTKIFSLTDKYSLKTEYTTPAKIVDVYEITPRSGETPLSPTGTTVSIDIQKVSAFYETPLRLNMGKLRLVGEPIVESVGVETLGSSYAMEKYGYNSITGEFSGREYIVRESTYTPDKYIRGQERIFGSEVRVPESGTKAQLDIWDLANSRAIKNKTNPLEEYTKIVSEPIGYNTGSLAFGKPEAGVSLGNVWTKGQVIKEYSPLVETPANKIVDISPFVLTASKTSIDAFGGRAFEVRKLTIEREMGLGKSGDLTYEADIGVVSKTAIEKDIGESVIASGRTLKASSYINEVLGSSFPAKGKPTIGEYQQITQGLLDRLATRGTIIGGDAGLPIKSSMTSLSEYGVGSGEIVPAKGGMKNIWKSLGETPQKKPGSTSIPDYMKSGRESGGVVALEREMPSTEFVRTQPYKRFFEEAELLPSEESLKATGLMDRGVKTVSERRLELMGFAGISGITSDVLQRQINIVKPSVSSVSSSRSISGVASDIIGKRASGQMEGQILANAVLSDILGKQASVSASTQDILGKQTTIPLTTQDILGKQISITSTIQRTIPAFTPKPDYTPRPIINPIKEIIPPSFKFGIPSIPGGISFSGGGGRRRTRVFTERYNVGSFEVVAGGIFGGGRTSKRRSSGGKLKIGRIKI
jgi:hypothetical protein